MNFKSLFQQLKDAYNEWSNDKATRMAAALAYYTIFSIAPLLVIAIAVAGLIFGREAAQGQLLQQISGLTGPQGGQAVQTMVENAGKQEGHGAIATVISVFLLLFGAAAVFGELQDALNTVWGVKPDPKAGIWAFIRRRFLSFGMVMGIAFLLLVSLVASTVLSAAVGQLADQTRVIGQVLNFTVSFAVITMLFAMMFKFLPDVKIAWRDVWIGSLVTALLFTIGKQLIGLYLGRSSVASVYGAAGSLVVLLLWAFYSAQIFFFGAEMTKVYARGRGGGKVPARGAVPMTEEAKARQGMGRDNRA